MMIVKLGRLVVVAMYLALATGVSAVIAQEGASLAGQATEADALSVVRNYLKEIGGIDEVASLRAASCSGVMEIPDAGLAGDVNLWLKSGKFLMSMELAAIGKIEMGCDGGNVWEINPHSGDRILEGAARADAIRDRGFLVPEMEYIGNYQGQLVHVGEKQIDGKTLIQINAVPNTGSVSQRYYDKSTGLLEMVVADEEIQGSAYEVTTTYSDYRKVGAVLLPHYFTMEAAGQMQTLEFTSIDPDAKIDETQFEMPESLKPDNTAENLP